METQQAPQAIERPRFRSDLVAQPFEEEGVRYVDVTDPNSGATFRFYDVEYSIACAMDGERDLDGLSEWVRLELGIDTSPEELTGVISTLSELGYLEAATLLAESQGSTDVLVGQEPTYEPGNGVHAAASLPDDTLELGPPGASPMGRLPMVPPVETEALELGEPGVGHALTDEESAALDASFESEALELGAPGAVPPVEDTSYAPAYPTLEEAVPESQADPALASGMLSSETGIAGVPSENSTADEGASLDLGKTVVTETARDEASPSAESSGHEIPAPSLDPALLAPARPTEDEMSFAGLLDDDGAPVPAPAPMQHTQELHADDLEEGSAPHPLPDDDLNPSRPAPPPLPEFVAQGAQGERSATDANEQYGDEPTQLPGAMPGGLAASDREDRDDDEEVAVDLSVHLSLDKHEVNEAVRASKVLMVPEISKDLMAELDAPVFDPAEKDRVEAEAGLDALVMRASTPLPVAPPESGADSSVIPLPAQPPSAVKMTDLKKAVPGARKPPSNLFAWVILALAATALLAGMIIFWVLKKPDSVSYDAPRRGTSAKEPAPTATLAPRIPGVASGAHLSPGLPGATLELGVGIGSEVAASVDGRVAWIVFDEQEVAAGDPVAKLQGFQKWEKELASVTDRLRFYEGQLAKAGEANNAAAVGAAQRKVEEKQGLIDQARAKLAPLVMTAPTAGKAQMLVGASAMVKAGDPLVRVVTGKPALQAVFDSPAAASYVRETACIVAAKAAPDKQLSCVVAKVEGNRVTVRLVPGAAAKAGDAVVLLPAKK